MAVGPDNSVYFAGPGVTGGTSAIQSTMNLTGRTTLYRALNHLVCRQRLEANTGDIVEHRLTPPPVQV